MSAFTDRRGFALPLAILALALVTAAVAASNAATRAEIVADQSVRGQDRAYQLAEAGLQQFLARRGETGWCGSKCVTDPTTQQYKLDSTEATRVNLAPYGYADVVAVRVRPHVPGDSIAIFFIRSRGVDTTVKLSGAGFTVYAERTVGQYASYRPAKPKALAALVSITGVSKNSSTSILDGTDECSLGGCSCSGSVPAITGVVTPTGELAGSGAGTNVSSASSMSVSALKALVGIDWDAIINKNAIPADYTIPGSSWPGAGNWRVTRVKTSPYTIPSDGDGILIVEGDLNLTSGRDFDGIILVGGRITASGSQPSSGLAFTGLNYLLPGWGTPPAGPADNTTLSSTKSFKYNSCNVTRAMAVLDMYFAWPNTWLDNVAIW